MRRYVITGGPGSGKTSIMIALELMGKIVVREAAEDMIRYMQALGIEKPWENQKHLTELQYHILNAQRLREKNIPQNAEEVWLDRSFIDNLAYQKEGSETYGKFLELSRKMPVDKVFLIEQLGKSFKNSVRKENLEQAFELERRIREAYGKFGHSLIPVPPAPLGERVDFILKSIKD